MKGTRPLDNDEIRKVSVSGDFRMSVKYLFSTLAILLATLTFFALDTLADTESADDVSMIILCGLLGILLLVLSFMILARKKRNRLFLKEHRSLLASDDPKVLLELVEKCNEYRDRRNIPEVASLAR